jgi:hypothetical protein
LSIIHTGKKPNSNEIPNISSATITADTITTDNIGHVAGITRTNYSLPKNFSYFGISKSLDKLEKAQDLAEREDLPLSPQNYQDGLTFYILDQSIDI